jgi:hypothetical protein
MKAQGSVPIEKRRCPACVLFVLTVGDRSSGMISYIAGVKGRTSRDHKYCDSVYC